MHCESVEHARKYEVSNFSSYAWSYEHEGPVNGTICTIPVRIKDNKGALKKNCDDNPQNERGKHGTENSGIMLKIFRNQQRCIPEQYAWRIKAMLDKMEKSIRLVARQAELVAHNYMVNQVVTYSPLNLHLDLQQCEKLDQHP